MSKDIHNVSARPDVFEALRVALEAAEREHNRWFHSNCEGDGYCYLWGAGCNGVDPSPWTKFWRKLTGREARSRDAAQFLAFMLCKSKAASLRINSPPRFEAEPRHK